MAIRINYLEIRNQSNAIIGEIEFFDSYKTPSANFPYFYLGEKNTTIIYQNWPNLVEYLYDKTISTVDINKIATREFPIYSFSNAANIATLNFNDTNTFKAIKALIEDRLAYYIDNNTFVGWNKTITFLNSITISGTTYFTANTTYYIASMTINEQTGTSSITVGSNSVNVVNNSILTNIKLEFGLFRIPGQSSNESVYYTGIKGRFLCNNDETVFVGGLKIRSQIMGHAHNHQHSLNNHSHTMSHQHGLNNHTHYMSHNHSYTDDRSIINGVTFGDSYLKTLSTSLTVVDQYRDTSQSTEFTSSANINITTEASNTTTDSISGSNTSNVLTKSTDDDNSIFSNINLNFKVNSKIIPESYTLYAYFYGGQYNQ
jgi:hypothetical protein